MIWGETTQAYMDRHAAERAKRREWHLWFAWRPVKLDTGQKVWLETVWRQEYEGIYDSYWRYAREQD